MKEKLLVFVNSFLEPKEIELIFDEFFIDLAEEDVIL